MTEIDNFCHNCSSATTAQVGQSIAGSRLLWHVSYICHSCGSVLEVDEEGFPPAWIRNKIEEQDGSWSLQINESGSNRVKATLQLRELLHLRMQESAKLKELIPGIVLSGTRTEMEWLSKILISRGIQAKAFEVNPETH